VKIWEMQQFSTVQDHSGASMWYRRASTVPKDLQILLVNSWTCHPHTDQSNSAQSMEETRLPLDKGPEQ